MTVEHFWTLFSGPQCIWVARPEPEQRKGPGFAEARAALPKLAADGSADPGRAAAMGGKPAANPAPGPPPGEKLAPKPGGTTGSRRALALTDIF